MSKDQETFVDRLKKQTLAFWGSLCVFAGMFSGLASNMLVDAGDMRRSEAQAARLGGAMGGGLIVVIGIVLIVIHFVRRKTN